jgi:hypothetical protein
MGELVQRFPHDSKAESSPCSWSKTFVGDCCETTSVSWASNTDSTRLEVLEVLVHGET